MNQHLVVNCMQHIFSCIFLTEFISLTQTNTLSEVLCSLKIASSHSNTSTHRYLTATKAAA